MKLISFDLKADFAFFRKPETNATLNLSYNIIHKPAVLGILGAIIGLEGYREKGKLPQYYQVLKDIQIGIEPLNHDKGNYAKTNIKYSNTIGYANRGANFLTEELTLIEPEYRIYLLIDETHEYHQKLSDYLSKGMAEYIPYLGKNEFTAWWNSNSYHEYTFLKGDVSAERIKISSIFQRSMTVKNNSEAPVPDFLNPDSFEHPFMYFERLPKGFDLELIQYDIADFVYSNYYFKNTKMLKNLVYVNELDSYVQLF